MSELSEFDIMWHNAVKEMISVINSDNNMRDYFMDFIPNESTGYAWTQNIQYKKYSAILDLKTNTVHSGASFACCVREAVEHIRKGIVIAEEAEELDIITLQPIT